MIPFRSCISTRLCGCPAQSWSWSWCRCHPGQMAPSRPWGEASLSWNFLPTGQRLRLLMGTEGDYFILNNSSLVFICSILRKCQIQLAELNCSTTFDTCFSYVESCSCIQVASNVSSRLNLHHGSPRSLLHPLVKATDDCKERFFYILCIVIIY